MLRYIIQARRSHLLTAEGDLEECFPKVHLIWASRHMAEFALLDEDLQEEASRQVLDRWFHINIQRLV